MDDSLYDDLADLAENHWWIQGRRRVVASVLRRRLGPQAGHEILDIGCGTGEMVDMLCEFGSVTGLDMSEKAARYCRERFGDRVTIRVGRIPEDITPANVVTAFDVLEHLDDDLGALDAIYRALPSNGLLVCTVPALQFLWSGHDEIHHHKRRYTRTALRRALRGAGFEVEMMSYFNSLLFPVVAAIRAVHRIRSIDDTGSDLAPPPPAVNALLARIFAAERWLLRVTSLPIGVSLVAVCRKPDGAARPVPGPAVPDRMAIPLR